MKKVDSSISQNRSPAYVRSSKRIQHLHQAWIYRHEETCGQPVAACKKRNGHGSQGEVNIHLLRKGQLERTCQKMKIGRLVTKVIHLWICLYYTTFEGNLIDGKVTKINCLYHSCKHGNLPSNHDFRSIYFLSSFWSHTQKSMSGLFAYLRYSK